MAVINLNDIENVTLYTGNNGSSACTCKCPCCSQTARNRRYQGNIEQAIKMFDMLPKMKQLYLFGNPDVTVDSDFCHTVMLEAISRKIHVCFSTSGVGGINVLAKLLNNISPSMVDYISFSFDSIDEDEMSYMKGITYPMEKALKGIEWALERGYTVKVQPTLWSCNYNKTGEIIEFFRKKGVKWFTFHIGSLESGISLVTHKHLTPEQINMVHEQITKAVCIYNDIKVRCPIIYMECGENDEQKWYCMHPDRAKELLVMFTENGIKATHVPMASLFQEDLYFYLERVNQYDIPAIHESKKCPFTYGLSGTNETCCRYISKYWNY